MMVLIVMMMMILIVMFVLVLMMIIYSNSVGRNIDIDDVHENESNAVVGSDDGFDIVFVCTSSIK